MQHEHSPIAFGSVLRASAYFARANFSPLLVYLAIVVVGWLAVQWLGDYIIAVLQSVAAYGLFAYAILGLALAGLFQCGFILLLAALNQQKSLAPGKALLRGLIYLPSYLLAYILMNLAVLCGLIFFVFPGIYVYARLLLFDFFILLGGKDPLQALGASFSATRAAVWTLIVATLVFSGTLIGLWVLNTLSEDVVSFFKYAYTILLWGLSFFFTIVRYRFFLLLNTSEAR